MESDWNTALAQVKTGFKVLADLLLMKPMTNDVSALNEKVQKKIIDTGVKKVAMVTGSASTRITVSNIGTKSGMNQMAANFSTVEDAQKWLNE